MGSARRYTLIQNDRTNVWELIREDTRKVVRRFRTKTEATSKGVLENAIGKDGGSVVIRKKGGVFEEQRNYRARV